MCGGTLTTMTDHRHAERRAQFLELLGDTIAIIAAGTLQTRNDDVDHGFRQDSDFFFLTGFPEPDAVAVFDPTSADPYTLFVQPRDPETESWNGRRAGPDGAKALFGADAAHTIDELAPWLRRTLTGRTSIGRIPGTLHADAIDAALATARGASERLGSAAPSETLDVRSLLHEMRLVKTDAEIAALREACRISAVAHVEAMRFAAPGRTERQVQAAVEYVFGAMDAERVGYGSIVAGGDNAVILHYVENDQPLRDGDLLLIDAGAEFRHMTADITRTFPINGRFSAPQRGIYDAVLLAERNVIDLCAPGLAYTDMHTRAVRTITEGLVDLGLLPGTVDDAHDKGWYREFFFHGTGHWLGSDVHDAGAYRTAGAGRPLVPGMAFTVEPGIYVAPEKQTITLSHASYDPDEAVRMNLELGTAEARRVLAERKESAGTFTFEVPPEFLGLGVRIEDDILITADGHENMTAKVPVDPVRIEEICGEDSALPLFS